MPRRPCLDCQSLAIPGRARCYTCTRTRDRQRGSRQQRGYNATHEQRRAAAIAAEPWCHYLAGCPYLDAGTPTNPLSLEHLDPLDRDGPVTVLCHRCNSARRHRA
jgi:hypothetical protein